MVLTDVGCLHSIQILNIRENEVFYYPFILIKGYVTGSHRNCINTKCIVLNYANSKGSSQKTPLQNDKFKVLLYLNEGKNCFTLQYCSCRKELVLFLERPATKYLVRPVYVVCKDHNGLFQAPDGCDNSVESACKRISIGAKLLQTIIAEKLSQHGYRRKTFQLETSPECSIFRSRLTTKQVYTMDHQDIWEFLGREIMKSPIGSVNCKFLAFLSCTFSDGNAVYADVALGGGGLALYGTRYLYTWPTTFEEILNCFQNDKKINTCSSTNDGFRGTYGSCFSMTLGAVCHELGHAFDLGHSKEGLMGCDYYCADSVFTFRNIFNENLTKKVSYPSASRRNMVNCLQTFNEQIVLPIENFIQQLHVSYCVVPSTNEGKNKTTSDNNSVNSVCRLNAVDKKESHKVFPSDWLFFTYSCATLLNYHRWFNYLLVEDTFSDLNYDSNRGIVKSTAGIVVVQLRNNDGYVLRSWEFLSDEKKRIIFIVPLVEVRKAKIIFIEDATGNIIKEDIQRFI